MGHRIKGNASPIFKYPESDSHNPVGKMAKVTVWRSAFFVN